MTEQEPTASDVSDEEIELNAYLGHEAVMALCEVIGPDGRDIVASSWRDGFAAGAEAVENAIDRAPFNHYVLIRETEGSYAGDLLSIRVTCIDRTMHVYDGYNLNEQEDFAAGPMLSDTTKKALKDIVNRYVHQQQAAKNNAAPNEQA
jgi:hypothetical protein